MVIPYLTDSSIVSKYINGNLPTQGLDFMDFVLEVESNISIISKIELLSWVTDEAKLYRKVEIFIEDSEVLLLTDDIVLKTIELRKRYKLKTPDAIIAATALIHKLTLLTDNERDFRNIKNLKIINPNTMNER